MASLPDGGPLSVTLDRRGIDIGRDSHLDWTLPDPDRFISGKHAEVRYRDGGYWLHDVSTNGTSVNTEHGRLKAPHLLADGDRVHIGRYIVAVTLTGEPAAMPRTEGPAAAPAALDPWGGVEGAAEAGNRRDFQAGPAGGGPRYQAGGEDIADADFSWSVGAVTPAAAPAADWASPAAPAWTAPSPAAEAPPAWAPPPAADPGAVDWSAPAVPVAPEWAPPPAADWGSPPAPSAPPAVAPRPNPAAADWGAASPAPTPAPAPVSGGLASQWTETPPEPVAPPVAPAPVRGAGEDWVAAFERGAGLPAGAVAGGGEPLAEEMGALMRLVADNLKQMLSAREATKAAMRSSSRTMIGAAENNPLKFSPTPEDALRIMFGQKTRSYLDARQTLTASFNDLKAHQMQTFGAMQSALAALVEDLDPASIDQATPGEGGIAALVSSRRAKLWDIYVERFRAKSARHERGMVDAFMVLFAEMYDRQGR